MAAIAPKPTHPAPRSSPELDIVPPQSPPIRAVATDAKASAPAAGAGAGADAKKEFVTVTLPDGRSAKFPLLKPTAGAPCIDIQSLSAQLGVFTYDPGFTSTASCSSTITYIDGGKGLLAYRGYPVVELVKRSDFMDVAFLLLHGELPSPHQKVVFEKDLHFHAMIHEKLIQFYKGFKSDAHPMAIMVGVVGALSAFYHDSVDVTKPEQRLLSAYRLIAKIPTIAAIAYKTAAGQPIVYPRADLTYAENFLYMMFAKPTEDYVLDPVAVKAIEAFLILHADHEQNASTSTVRIAGSSDANPFACVASGIAALWGPAHGGANEAVIKMLVEIKSKERIPEFVRRAKDKNDSFRLMGFGHRVYKNFDPRATYMKQICYDVLKTQGLENDPLFEIALELERVALADEYFKTRKLYPNVDFYSGIVLRALGIPLSMFTVLFAVARTTGWISQWKEMVESPIHKIGRPQQLYTGAAVREFVPVAQRKEVVDPAVVEAYNAKAKAAANGKKVAVRVQQSESI